MNKIKTAGHKLGWEQRNAVWRICGIVERDGKGTVCLHTVAAAGEKTADASQSLRKRDRRKDQIHIG